MEATASQEFITKLILEERLRQDKKWGADRDQNNFMWQVILTEEVGEAAESILKNDADNLQKELIQCAAVIYAWLENLDRQSGIGWNEGGRTPLAPDVLARCQKCNALIETTVHCDNCGTFEPTRR